MMHPTPAKSQSALDVFQLRQQLVSDYCDYLQSFLSLSDDRIKAHVREVMTTGQLWPEPLIQMNPAFEAGGWVDDLVGQKLLHADCSKIFCLKSDESPPSVRPMRLHRHQREAIERANQGKNYVLTTGTGSGKSLSYIVPIVDWVLREGSGKGIRAIIIYPMNALANSQMHELSRFLERGFPQGRPPVTFARYTGQEKEDERKKIRDNPPDILITNYVMMELLLTRPWDQAILRACGNLRFLVLDELHTYRGRQGADVALLVRRARERTGSSELLCVGTSATLSTSPDPAQQRADVAGYASRLFGSTVEPDSVVGETLRRITSAGCDRQKLVRRLQEPPPTTEQPVKWDDFLQDPLSSWMETTFGLRDEGGRLTRVSPRSIGGPEGAARELAELSGLSLEVCAERIQEGFLLAYHCENDPETGRPQFAFKLHQFFSKGDTVYASLEEPAERHLTLVGQKFVPGSERGKTLLPLAFCRECGQEYYTVFLQREGGVFRAVPRSLSERFGKPGQLPGFLFLDPERRWPGGDIADRVPEDWLDNGQIKKGIRRQLPREDIPPDFRLGTLLPQEVQVSPDGLLCEDGVSARFLAQPFSFCLACDVAYGAHQQSDIGKLSTLDTSGRSTATTLLTLSVHRWFHQFGEGLEKEARKLLSFTDNRQDASLQAGHFNDFVQVGWLRSALYRAVSQVGAGGILHDDLTRRVFEALDLPPEEYAQNAQARFEARQENERALREVLGYRIYRDLMRGWRVTFPNLEQCGLLDIGYGSLREVCEAEDVWSKLPLERMPGGLLQVPPALTSARPESRRKILKTLLDYLRRELAIHVDYLDAAYQDRIRQLSNQHLIEPWALDENEPMETSVLAFPGTSPGGRAAGQHLYITARGSFARYLKRELGQPLKSAELQDIIQFLFGALEVGGLVRRVRDAEVPGYQIPASALRWVAGSGEQAFHDPIRVPRVPRHGLRPNPYFVEYYQRKAWESRGITAREHTAQVPPEKRQEREEKFRQGTLPVMFCSPTMELGVDIRELNVVGLRNVPPTPANYAQRSGRAGRSGQPALVFTYCTALSPHDQYFFKRPIRMVSGAVSLPRIELSNEELVRAHVRAEWLAATGASLGSSLKEVLVLDGEPAPLTLQPDLVNDFQNPQGFQRALGRGQRMLASIQSDLSQADWHHDGWLEDVLKAASHDFDQASERWRELYRAALKQMDQQHRIIRDHSRSSYDKNLARRLYNEAHSQMTLLLETRQTENSDFNSYRYYASEGFLPGYNFPRLPLTAFVPGRNNRDEYLSRPRFLAISEFGPRAVIYHEGTRYITNRVALPSNDDPEEIGSGVAKRCEECGYMHPVEDGCGPDVCEQCDSGLGAPMINLFRMRSVNARRYDRIHCDEEERQRMGFEMQVGVRFERRRARLSRTLAELDGLARLSFGQAARIWRVNLGWKRRSNPDRLGFNLDLERGYWERDERDDTRDLGDAMSARIKRVIPFVDDHRNCLLIHPCEPLEPAMMLSLQAALKNAMQLEFQLEDSELAAESLPSTDRPRTMLFYEAAEGGAGVLRRLVHEPTALSRVARRALELCHFDPDTLEDRRRAERAREDCEAGCYDCLLSYTNQLHHGVLDRQLLPELLQSWSLARVSPRATSGVTRLEELLAQAGSELEKRWLRHIDDRQLRLPDEAQTLLVETRPDFIYREKLVAVYVDGPMHEFPNRRERDRIQQEALEDRGWQVVRFGRVLSDRAAEGELEPHWDEILQRYAWLFGSIVSPNPAATFDLSLFDPAWHDLVGRLARRWTVDSGGDLTDNHGNVIGFYEVEVRHGARRVRLVAAGSEGLEASDVPAVSVEPDFDIETLVGLLEP